MEQWPLTAGEYVVSGSLSSPLRGAFHLSLTVLVRYRSLKVLSLGGWSPQLPTNSPGFVVLRVSDRITPLCSTGLSPPLVALSNAFESAICSCCVSGPTTPTAPLARSGRFGLIPPRSPLLRDSRLISSRRATEMFQFARCPPHCLCIQQWVTRHDSGGVAPFGISGLIARMQLPLNVSPVSASFIGLQRLGIHLVLSLACLPTVVRSLLHTRLSRASRRLVCKHPLQARSVSLVFSFSALGKIEVILIYSVF